MELHYHDALMRAAMERAGFHRDAQRVAIWGNWSVDIWSLGLLGATRRGRHTSRLHFLNLTGSAAIEQHWHWLRHEASRRLARRQSAHATLYELGQLLHAVQDFYAHTNWVEVCLEAGMRPDAVPLWEDGLPYGASQGCLASAYYPDASAPHAALRHSALHKDHPDCEAGAEVFAAAYYAAQRATLVWLPHLLELVPADLRVHLRGTSSAPIMHWALLTSLGLIDRSRLPRLLAATPLA